MTRIFESLLEESNKKKFIKSWLGDDTERIDEYDETYEKYKQIFDNEVKKRGLNWQTSMNLETFEEILSEVSDRKAKTEIKKQNKSAGKSDFLSYVLADPDCDLTYLGTLNKWDYFKIESWHGAILANYPKASLHGDTGAQWCIGWRDSEKQRFDYYSRAGYDFVLIVKSDDSNKDKEEKYCIQVRRDTGKVTSIWNPIDETIDHEQKIEEISDYSTSKITLNPEIVKGIFGVGYYECIENKFLNIKNFKIYANELRITKNADFDGIEQYEFTNVRKIIFEKGIKKISDYLLQSNYFLEEVVLPKGLQEIGRASFSLCENLRKINLPNSLERIGIAAFSECKNLEDIKFGNNLKFIGSTAFYCCEKLHHIEIPSSVEEIGDQAFRGCENLETVDLSKFQGEIKDFAFVNCFLLKNVVFSQNIKSIDRGAFYGCDISKNLQAKIEEKFPKAFHGWHEVKMFY